VQTENLGNSEKSVVANTITAQGSMARSLPGGPPLIRWLMPLKACHRITPLQIIRSTRWIQMV